MEHILVTGSKGQLGQSICEVSKLYPNKFRFFYTDVEELDISNLKSIENYCKENKIETIINTAAYTAVDLAEEQVELCYLINRDGIANLSKVAKDQGLFLIHISTDYVFDGTSKSAYIETDQTNPLSVYGKSKLAGEEMMKRSGIDGAIIRTSWLYSQYGKNFLKTILHLSKEKSVLQVVDDQYGTPTNGIDLAEVLLQIAAEKKRIKGVEIFHYTNSGRCSWYDFAQLIVEKSGSTCKVLPVHTDSYPAKARRPQDSELSKEKLKFFLGIEIANWEERVEFTLKKLL
ncbi:MAG: dTDP-4-dehydrorhamnose reductase [Bacteroidales bacterium]|jgi:dTDP-4-dehydrorhamnose reductase|nr:dTDP-4-dehydrorhamnose reductase [Bacteroidales bacterium]